MSRAPDEALLGDRQWRRLAPRLPGPGSPSAAGDTARRAQVIEALRALRYGERGSDAARRRRAAWLRNGAWVDLWMAYVASLSGRERDAWRRDLERAAAAGSDTSLHDRAWRLVSLRLLIGERR